MMKVQEQVLKEKATAAVLSYQKNNSDNKRKEPPHVLDGLEPLPGTTIKKVKTSIHNHKEDDPKQHKDSSEEEEHATTDPVVDEVQAIRERNALYSRRSYHRKRMQHKELELNAMKLTESNFSLRKENERLEQLLLVCQAQVVQHHQQQQQLQMFFPTAAASLGLGGQPLFPGVHPHPWLTTTSSSSTLMVPTTSSAALFAGTPSLMFPSSHHHPTTTGMPTHLLGLPSTSSSSMVHHGLPPTSIFATGRFPNPPGASSTHPQTLVPTTTSSPLASLVPKQG